MKAIVAMTESSWKFFQVDGFGYRLVGVPNTAFVLDGSETAYVIHVNAGGELFQSLVELKVKEAPQGVTATFDRKWITAGATATLKVAVAKGKVPPGSYKLTVEGEAAVGGGMVRMSKCWRADRRNAGKNQAYGCLEKNHVKNWLSRNFADVKKIT